MVRQYSQEYAQRNKVFDFCILSVPITKLTFLSITTLINKVVLYVIEVSYNTPLFI